LKKSISKIKSPAQASKRIYAFLKAQITDGLLQAGSKLPSTRALASEHHISRTTVTAVFEQLAAEGYIETMPGAVAKVAAGIATTLKAPVSSRPRAGIALKLSAYAQRANPFDLQSTSQEPHSRLKINFLYGALAPDDFPKLAWRRAYDRALLQRQVQLYYASAQGEAELRAEIQGYLRRARGLTCSADQILIVNGSQQAIDLCARMLLNPGDHVAIEEPCYQKAHHVFQAMGAQMLAIPVDELGLRTQQLPKNRCSLVYVTPSHQFPLGGVMPIARRHELLAWAGRNHAWIVEDDYDGEFRYGLRPVDALQSIDQEGCVIYVGTFSKALSPQLRIGYLVLPQPLVNSFVQAKTLIDRHTPRLEQAALASLISSGVYERHIRRARRENERRRIALLQAIEKYLTNIAHVEGTASGLHVVLWIKNISVRQEASLVEQAMMLGVGVRPISPMHASGLLHRSQTCAGLVLGYASLSQDEIAKGIEKLAQAVKKVRLQSTK
jgi:GntR family transcriptional regulator / MocR family aminotransferase